MSPTEIAVSALLIPAAASAVTLLLFAWGLRRLEVAGGDHAAAALAVGVGYLAGHAAVAMPAVPPGDVTDRIPWLVGAAMILGLFESLAPGPAWLRWENRLLLTAVVVVAMLGPVWDDRMSAREGRIGLAAMGAAVLLLWAATAGLAARAAPATLGLSLPSAVGVSGVALILSGSLVLGQLAIALAAALAAPALWSIRAPAPSALGRGAVPVAVAALGALILDGQVYASLARWPALALAAAPAAAWVGFIPPLRRRSPGLATALGVVAAVAVAGIAVGIAASDSTAYEE